ncbi:MAG: TonB-dependent receptor [Chitinophagaceae bacterium]|nr:TonB-dependent receptor [Chitinophagaceae bacterium]
MKHNVKRIPVISRKRFCIAVCILLNTLAASAQLKDLTEKITLRLTGTNALEVIRELDKQSNYTFTYEQPRLAAVSIRHIQFDHVTLGEVLSRLQKEYHLSYSIRDGNISVRPEAQGGAMPADTSDGRRGGSGVLKGRVVDFETAQPLPGATVEIAGSGRATVADEKGYYVFSGLPEGSITLRVSYAGYQKNIFPDIRITRTLVFDVKMSAATATALNEVVVQSNAHRVKAVTFSTEKDLVQEIRNATSVISGISNEQISKTADRNAAEIVKRISGVRIVDDKFIVVRGMDPRYNVTYLNGNLAPSLELYSRAFAYDLLPSPIIDKILIYKSPEADLFGDFAGGAVKVTTKNAKPVRHFDVGVQLGYRPGSNFGSTINTYQGGKWDLLGFDDGTRKLPSAVPGYFEKNNQAPLTQSQLVKAFTPILQYQTQKSTPDGQVFFNYFDNWKIGNAHLYDLTSVTYTRETRHYQYYNQTGNLYSWGGFFNTKNKIGGSDQSTQISKINLLENLTLRLNPASTIEFKNFVVEEGRSMTFINDSRLNTDTATDRSFGYPRKRAIVLGYQQRFLYTGNLGGQHDWGRSHRQRLEWNLGYSYIRQDIPDYRTMNFNSYTGANNFYQTDPESGDYKFVSAGSNTGDQGDIQQGMISRLFVRNIENAYNGSADYVFRLTPSLTLKTGTYQLYKTREVSRRDFVVNRGGLTTLDLAIGFNGTSRGNEATGSGNNYFNLIQFRPQDLGKVWSTDYIRDDGTGLYIYDLTTPVDGYTASEQNNTGYLMADWTVYHSLLINAGVRVEHDLIKLSGAKGDLQFWNPVYVHLMKTDVLPSVNLSYRPDSAFVIRAGYGRTINRPEFRELAPFSDFDFQNNQYIFGNPNALPATIDNFDLRGEWYPKSSQANETFSAGIFYKHLRNPIQRVREDDNGADLSFPIISFYNATQAKVYGVEAEIRKGLYFIPGNLFRHLSVIINGAWIKSSSSRDSANGPDYIGPYTDRPLQGQAPYVLNGGLYYENPAWGTKLGVIYNVSGPNIYAMSVANPNSRQQVINHDSSGYKFIRPSLVELPMHLLDISYTQRIVKSLTMKLNVQNLLDQPFRLIEDYNGDRKYQPEHLDPTAPSGRDQVSKIVYSGDNIFQRYKPGRYFTLTFTYAF